MLVEGTVGLPAGPEFDRLADELMGLRMVTTKEGKIRIQDPRRSPDYADSVLTALSVLVDRPSVVTAHLDWL